MTQWYPVRGISVSAAQVAAEAGLYCLQPTPRRYQEMRKLITLVFLGAALAVPAATAAPTKGKPTGPKPCHGKAKVMVVLKGTFANNPVTGDISLELTVLRTNRWGRGYMK